MLYCFRRSYLVLVYVRLSHTKDCLPYLMFRVVDVDCHAREPQNVAVAVRSTVYLHCWVNATTTPVHWDNYARDNPTVFDGNEIIQPLRKRYSTEVTASQNHLIISGVTVTDAGNYSCYEESQQPNFAVLLVVLRSTFRRHLHYVLPSQ